MTGGWVDTYPDDVKALYKAGHELGNHSQNHKQMSTISAAECEEFIPVLFHKEQDPADDIFLFCLIVAKGISVDVNVQTASRCLMRTVAHGNCLPKEFLPVHGFHVIIQCHGMGNDLKAVFQRTIRLDVNVFLMNVSNAFETGGVIVVLAAVIHFQFYAEVSLSVSVENGCGLVTVLFDLVLKLVEASFAVGQVAVPADDAFRNDLPAGFAAPPPIRRTPPHRPECRPALPARWRRKRSGR